MWQFVYESWSENFTLRYEEVNAPAPMTVAQKVIDALWELAPVDREQRGDEFMAVVYFREEEGVLLVEEVSFTIYPHHTNCPRLCEALEELVG